MADPLSPTADDAAVAQALQADEYHSYAAAPRQRRSQPLNGDEVGGIALSRASIASISTPRRAEAVRWHSAVDLMLATLLLVLASKDDALRVALCASGLVAPVAGVYISRAPGKWRALLHAASANAATGIRVVVAASTPNFLVAASAAVLVLPACHSAWLASQLAFHLFCR